MSCWRQVVGAFTAIVACAVFGVPAGVLGDGFGDAISDSLEEAAKLIELHKKLEDACEPGRPNATASPPTHTHTHTQRGREGGRLGGGGQHRRAPSPRGRPSP